MSRAARPYAEALFSLAVEQGEDVPEAWSSELGAIAGRLGEPAVAAVVRNPALPDGARRALLRRVAGEAAPRMIQNFVQLLGERGRLGELPDIIREFDALRRERTGEIVAVAETARPVDEREREAIGRAVARLTGRSDARVKLEIRHVPALLGGIRLRLGDRVYDASVAGKFARLKSAVNRGVRE